MKLEQRYFSPKIAFVKEETPRNNKNNDIKAMSDDSFTKTKASASKVSFGSTEMITNGLNHNCYFFRGDINWKKLSDYIVKTYKMPPKLIFEACSDGSECYAMALALINKLGDDAQKYFPIVARDFDKDIITEAKKGIIGLSDIDKLQMEGSFNNIHPEKYFKKIEDKNYPIYDDNLGRYKVDDKLKDTVNFEVKDLEKSSEEKIERPTAIFVRNVAHQIPQDDFENIIHNYSKNLEPNSLFITGAVENLQKPEIGELIDNYFKTVESANTNRFGDVLYKSVREQPTNKILH